METWQTQVRAATKAYNSLVEERYRTLVPKYYLDLINPMDPNDPIARMALPSTEELIQRHGLRDPIGDLTRQAAPRLTHRYGDRALLHVTNLCPMYCRFCFRKNLMNEKDEDLYGGDFTAAFSYLGNHPEISELIFTGGDPWMLTDEKISALVDMAAEIPSIKTIRFHTRMPVTMPSRVTDDLLKAILRPNRLKTVVVTHFNHANEVTEAAEKAVDALRTEKIWVLNQTVLLRGVNDSLPALLSLFQALGDAGVMPYYLHHCDLVAGAEHFRVPREEGLALWQSLRGKISGYLIPEFVEEKPEGEGKVPVKV
jgi:lysine 2,3-aminomutase